MQRNSRASSGTIDGSAKSVGYTLINRQCDKCGEFVEHKLHKVPFLYMDKNDDKHEDVSAKYGISESGYRQYCVCNNCHAKELRIIKKQKQYSH